MKKVVILAIAVVFAFAVQAQHVFKKGDVMFNAGIGVPHGNVGFIPSINFSGEIGVIPTGDIGLVSFGGLAEFQMGQYTYTYASTEFFPRFYIGARAAWHVHAFKSDVFDAYGGVGAGIAISGKTDITPSATDINPDVFVGGRWMFKPGMGLFAEVGYSGLSSLKFGITFGL